MLITKKRSSSPAETHHEQPLIRVWNIIEVEDSPPNLPKQVRSERHECPPRNLQCGVRFGQKLRFVVPARDCYSPREECRP